MRTRLYIRYIALSINITMMTDEQIATMGKWEVLGICVSTASNTDIHTDNMCLTIRLHPSKSPQSSHQPFDPIYTGITHLYSLASVHVNDCQLFQCVNRCEWTTSDQCFNLVTAQWNITPSPPTYWTPHLAQCALGSQESPPQQETDLFNADTRHTDSQWDIEHYKIISLQLMQTNNATSCDRHHPVRWQQ